MTTGSSTLISPTHPGCVGQAGQGRSERGVLCTRAIEDAEQRRHTRSGSYGHHPMPLPGALDLLALRQLKRATDDLAGLAGVDHVVDQVVARGLVDIEALTEARDQLGATG